MLDRLDSQQLSELMAYDSLEAMGDYRLLFQIAVLCCIVANANRGKNSKPYKPEDFLVVPYDAPPPPTADELLRKMKALTKGLGRG